MARGDVLRLAPIFLWAFCACNAIDGADQFKTGGDGGTGSDGGDVACPQSCIETSGTCLGSCAATLASCTSGSCNPGCQNKCNSSNTKCMNACVTTCTACHCAQSDCESSNDAGAD
jgi:hypothetical protein